MASIYDAERKARPAAGLCRLVPPVAALSAGFGFGGRLGPAGDLRHGGGRARRRRRHGGREPVSRAEGIWVFAYGSLMWDPGFAHLEVAPALLIGYHRSFCIYSVVYRGTPERPGLVLGLDHGGSCRGRAYRVAAAAAGEVLDYLHEREMIHDVYRRKLLPVRLGGRTVRAYTYVVDRSGRHYAGKLGLARAAEIIRRGAGSTGSNRAYLQNTVNHLDALGITDGHLHRLLEVVEGRGG